MIEPSISNRVMFCRDCGHDQEAEIVCQIDSLGRRLVFERCCVCFGNINGGGTYLKHDGARLAAWGAVTVGCLPVVRDNRPADSHWLTDPHAPAPDTALWEAVFALAYRLDGHDPAGVYGHLRGLRCMGATLEQRPLTLRLSPPPDMDRETLAGLLASHRERVVGLFDRAHPDHQARVLEPVTAPLDVPAVVETRRRKVRLPA